MTLRLKRRALLAATGALIAAPSVLRAQTSTTLTLGHGAAAGNPRSVAAQKFADLVAQKSQGRIKVNVAGSEQLGNDVAMLTSLRTGALDITANSQGPAAGLVPEIAALGLPFLFQDSAQAFAVLDGPIGQDLSTKFEAVGIRTLGWWDNGIRDITNSKRAVQMPGDLKGLKIRTPADPMTIDIFKALGAATQQIAFSELYVALQQGVVDGQENPLANIASSKLYEVNPYLSLSRHKWESTPFLMSEIAWGGMDEDGHKVIQAAAKEAGDLQHRLMEDGSADLLKRFKAMQNVKVNDVDRAAFKQATAGVIDAWSKKPFGDFVKKLVAAAQA